jgi:hypothetical protein
MGHIAILVHKNASFENPNYVLHAFTEIWRENGWHISVLQGPQGKIAADLAILHVDLTMIPHDYVEYLEQFPKVLNGRITDISKRKISTNLVRRKDGYDGPVIVKTNRNCGGRTDAELATGTNGLRRRALAMRRRLPWSMRNELETSRYKVFSSARDVPYLVWLNPGLVVERFLPEMREGFYCLRTWIFLGDRETNSVSYSQQPIVKSSNVVRREVVPDVPEELRQVRRNMGFDFGKFDYSIVDGRVVLYDTNSTPTLGAIPKEQYLPRAQHLAEGLKAFL